MARILPHLRRYQRSPEPGDLLPNDLQTTLSVSVCRPHPPVATPGTTRVNAASVAPVKFVAPLALATKANSCSHSDKLTRNLPQTTRVTRIDGIGRDPREVSWASLHDHCLIAVLEVAATNALQQRRCGQQHRRRGALLGRLRALGGSPEATCVLLKVGGNGPRMNS